MPPSPRSADAADAFKTLDRADAQTIIDMIQTEVHHRMSDLADRLHDAEAYVSEHAKRAKLDFKTTQRKASKAVRANPLPAGLMIAGVGILITAYLIPKKAA